MYVDLKENEFIIKFIEPTSEVVTQGGNIAIINPHKDKGDSAAYNVLCIMFETMSRAMNEKFTKGNGVSDN